MAEPRQEPERRPAAGSEDARPEARRAHRAERLAHASEGQKPPRKRKPSFIERRVNAWFTRIMGAAAGSAAHQAEQYASHRTSRDYVWNSIGMTACGFTFPILTVVVSQITNVEEAGMFSMAFVVGMLLMIVGSYGVRTYQVSDLQEVHSFGDYQINRWATCIAMLAFGFFYCLLRDYESDMVTISMAVYTYKMIDGLADVYEGRLQQMDKLYLAGISQTVRAVAVIVTFSLTLLVLHNLAFSCIVMALAAAASFVLVTFPLALLETPKSRKRSLASIGLLFKLCFPVFIALFLYALIDTMPKFVMEGNLSYDNQLYFNALYFPAQSIMIIVGLVYKPLLLRMASLWTDQRHRRTFDLVTFAIFAFIIALTIGMVLLMNWVGLSAMSFLYGVDFEQFRGLCLIMVATGGVTACIDFLYQIITVLRQQRSAMRPYLITFGFSLFIPVLLVTFTGLPGAVIGYLIVMCILLVLLVWEYLRMRLDTLREPATRRQRSIEDTAAPPPSAKDFSVPVP